MSGSDQALAYVREHYRVPARRGQRVLVRDFGTGTITGGSGAHLIVRFDSAPKRKVILHPTWRVEYLRVLWLCTGCGVWSHAKRRPKHHGRTVTEEPADGVRVLEELPGSYSHITGEGESDAWLIACGPFERWEARRVADA